jgi:hypothetical protein
MTKLLHIFPVGKFSLEFEEDTKKPHISTWLVLTRLLFMETSLPKKYKHLLTENIYKELSEKQNKYL